MSNYHKNQHYESASVGTQLAESFQNSAFVKYFASPQGLTIVALLLFLGMGSLMQGGRGTKVTKGKLANGRFGGSKELAQAKKVALNQLQVR